MKTWEEVEFDAQQEAIRKWAEKKLFKMANGWWLNRKLNQMQKMARIIKGKNNVIAYVDFMEVDINGERKTLE